MVAALNGNCVRGASVMVGPSVISFCPLSRTTDIPWEGGRRLANWWFATQDKCSWPSLKDFDPQLMGRFLPGVLVVDVLEGGRKFQIRLAGEEYRLNQAWRLKGADLQQFPLPYPPNERIRWLVRKKRPYLARNVPAPKTRSDVRRYSVVAFPLFDDGEEVTAVIAHTNYEKKR